MMFRVFLIAIWASATVAAAAPPLASDPIQACLDQLHRQIWQDRQNAKKQAPNGEPYTFHRIEANDLPPVCDEGNLNRFRRALAIQIRYCKLHGSSERTIRLGCRMYSPRELCLRTNEIMARLARRAHSFGALADFIKAKFDWYKSDGKLDDGDIFKKGDWQFTAYYGPPPLAARRRPSPEFNYPIYRRPRNLIDLRGFKTGCDRNPITGEPYQICLNDSSGTLKPYFDRKAIDAGHALKDQHAEIAYVHNPVDVALLMVEGSGAIQLRDVKGSSHVVRLNYDITNGRTRSMLGAIIKCAGGEKKDYSSEAGIRAYLAAHKDQRSKLLDYDQSYVFFKPSSRGPYGVDDLQLTARFSFATDRRVIPTGTLMLYRLPRPNAVPGRCPYLSSFAIAQDTGGAIVGAHSDMYFGEGLAAKAEANDINLAGEMIVAVPKGAGRAIPNCE